MSSVTCKNPSAPPAYYYTITTLCLVIAQIFCVYPAQNIGEMPNTRC
jgi:hypothetical protein